MRLILTTVVFTLAACVTPGAQSAPPPTTIRDTSYVEPSGSRAVQLSVWLPAPRREVYRALTTAEGWMGWAAPRAFGEPRTGATMETSYNPEAKAGDPGNIVQQFVALIPDRLVVFRTVRTPPGFPHAELYMRTASVMELADEAREGRSGTRLLFTHTGFGPEAGFDDLYSFFLPGDTKTIAAVEEMFGGPR